MLLAPADSVTFQKKQSSTATEIATTVRTLSRKFYPKNSWAKNLKSSGRQQPNQKSSYRKKTLVQETTSFLLFAIPRNDVDTVWNIGKMKYNLRKTVVNDSVRLQVQCQDNASSRDIIDDSDAISDAPTGLTQNFQNPIVKEQFRTTPGTILFIPDTVNKLYKVQVLENSGHEIKIRYSGWGSEHNSSFNGK